MKISIIIKWVNKNEGILTVLVALIAVAISIKSCMLSKDANMYSKKAFELTKESNIEEKLLVLKATINKEDKYFNLYPSNKEIILQAVDIFYPKSLGNIPWNSTKANFKIPTTLLNQSILEENIKEISRIIKNSKNTVAMYKGGVPLAIKSIYVYKGRRYTDLSFYTLTYESLLGLKDEIIPTLVFTIFYFVKRSNEYASFQQEIDNQWEIINSRSKSILKSSY